MTNHSVSIPVWTESDGSTPKTETIVLIQGESGARTLTVTFLDQTAGGETPLSLAGCTPRLYLSGTKPPVFVDGTVSGTAAVFTISASITANPGLYFCQFVLSGPDYPTIKFGGLALLIKPSALDEDAVGTDGFSALIAALNKAETASSAASEAVYNADAAASGANTAAAAANSAASAAARLPYIGEGDGCWYLYNTGSAQYGKTDSKAVLTPRGTYDSAVSYAKLDLVYDAGANTTFLSLKDGNASAPADDGVNWVTVCRGIGTVSDNNYTDADRAKVASAVPQSRTVAGLDLSADRTLAELVSAGLASGDSSGNAQNALKLGGTGASGFAQVSSGTWVPTIFGETSAGSPVYSAQTGVWYRAGNLCVLLFTLSLTSKSGISGEIHIGGLPFAAGAQYPLLVGSYLGVQLPASNVLSGFLYGGAKNISLTASGNTGTQVITDSMITNSFALFRTAIVYIAS